MNDLVTCPNCKGKPSTHWPGGPCTVCSGTGNLRVELTVALPTAIWSQIVFRAKESDDAYLAQLVEQAVASARIAT